MMPVSPIHPPAAAFEPPYNSVGSIVAAVSARLLSSM
jgi:hypothetical protein